MTPVGSWEQRRKYMFWNTAFNMAVITLCLATKQDTDTSYMAVEACFWSNSATLLFYVFGATVQDVVALRTGIKQSTVQVTENAGSPLVPQPSVPETPSVDSNTTINSSGVAISKRVGKGKVRRGD